MAKITDSYLNKTVGKTLNIHANIQSQRDIPRWDEIPLEIRQQFLDAEKKRLEHQAADVPNQP